MRFVICFGEYYFNRADNLGTLFARVVIMKPLQEAEWFNSVEEAEKIQKKYGGVVKSFVIELEEV